MNNDDWLNYYCEYWWDEPYLTEMRSKVWISNKLLILFPRGHGKTWTMIGLFVRFLLEKRLPIMVFCSGSNKSDIYFAVLELLESDRIVEKYGYTLAKQNEVRGEIWLSKKLGYRKGFIDPNFKIVGQLAKSIGKHPAWIVLEDIVQDIKASDEAEERVKRWFGRVVKFMKKRGLDQRTRLTIIGTRKDENDFYQYTLDTHKFPLYHIEALRLQSGRYPNREEVESNHELETCKLLVNAPGIYKSLNCPDWDIAALIYEYLWHPYDFEAEMQNNPVPTKGKHFKDCFIEEVEPFTSGELTNKLYMVIDPAFGKSAQSSDTAIGIIGLYMGFFWMVDVIIKKLNDTQLLAECQRLHKVYNPLITYGENDFHQLTRNATLYRGLNRLRGFEVFYQKGFGEKLSRIGQLHPPLLKGQFKIYRTATNKNELIKQKLLFNLRDGKFDGLDMMASGYRLLEPKLYMDDDEFFFERI